jgi:hypothetical protein
MGAKLRAASHGKWPPGDGVWGFAKSAAGDCSPIESYA